MGDGSLRRGLRVPAGLWGGEAVCVAHARSVSCGSVKDHQLYQQILGIESPWKVSAVELQRDEQEVRVYVERTGRKGLSCPKCDRRCTGYDTREREWRHLDTMQYRTILVGRIPRVTCPEHGVLQIHVPWAEPGSRFTALFEALAIDWLKEASISSVTGLLGLTWDELDGIRARAVKRGLSRRGPIEPKTIGVDETAFQKRHEYVTLVNDLDADTPHVLYVADDRTKSALDGFYAMLGPEACTKIETISMDMWEAYISSTRAHVPEADQRIVFDKFHIAMHLGDAVDRVRREENRILRKNGDLRLVGSRYLWLQHPNRMPDDKWVAFEPLRQSSLRTARAYAIKETVMASCWGYRYRAVAERHWERALSWMMRCRLEPVKRVARMIRAHYDGVLNASVSDVTNAHSERINEKIQWIKRISRGFRSRERFRDAIYFHAGGLDLYPEGLGVTHSNA